MIDGIIEYLEETYKMKYSDLVAGDKERIKLYAKLELIEELKEISTKGLPNVAK